MSVVNLSDDSSRQLESKEKAKTALAEHFQILRGLLQESTLTGKVGRAQGQSIKSLQEVVSTIYPEVMNFKNEQINSLERQGIIEKKFHSQLESLQKAVLKELKEAREQVRDRSERGQKLLRYQKQLFQSIRTGLEERVKTLEDHYSSRTIELSRLQFELIGRVNTLQDLQQKRTFWMSQQVRSIRSTCESVESRNASVGDKLTQLFSGLVAVKSQLLLNSGAIQEPDSLVQFLQNYITVEEFNGFKLKMGGDFARLQRLVGFNQRLARQIQRLTGRPMEELLPDYKGLDFKEGSQQIDFLVAKQRKLDDEMRQVRRFVKFMKNSMSKQNQLLNSEHIAQLRLRIDTLAYQMKDLYQDRKQKVKVVREKIVYDTQGKDEIDSVRGHLVNEIKRLQQQVQSTAKQLKGSFLSKFQLTQQQIERLASRVKRSQQQLQQLGKQVGSQIVSSQPIQAVIANTNMKCLSCDSQLEPHYQKERKFRPVIKGMRLKLERKVLENVLSGRMRTQSLPMLEEAREAEQFSQQFQ